MNKKETGFGKKGWALIIYCMLAFYVATAFKDSMNVAVYTFQEKYGWNQTLLLSLASIGAYVTCIAIYVLGIFNASGKLKLRKIILVTGIGYAITISLWGVIPNLSVFIINYIIMTVGYTVWTQYANNAVCANWFPKKSGAVVGWTTIGFPLAAATNSLLYATLIKYIKFEQVYFLYGILTVLICLWGYFGFRDYPEELGQYPDNDTTMTKQAVDDFWREQEEISKNSIWTTKKMLVIKETWLIGISTGVMILIASGSMGQMVVRFMTGGMEMDLAIKMMTIVGVCSMIGSWAIGKLDYRFGVKKAFIGTLAILIAACLLYSVSSTATMVAGAAIIGVGLGGSSNFIVSLTSRYWGRRNFKKAYGTILTVATVIGSSGALVVANLAAAFSYTTAYRVMAVFTIAALLFAIPLKEGFVERYESEIQASGGAKATSDTAK